MKHICRRCDKVFYARPSQVFCSYHCSNKSKEPWNKGTAKPRVKKHEYRILHTCPTCGIVFIGHKGRKFCSKKCVRHTSSWNKGMTGLPASRPKNGTDKVCIQCGKTFYTPACYSDAKFCSITCSAAARWGMGRQLTKTCPICRNTYTCMRSHSLATCPSAQCRREHKHRLQLGEKSHLWRGGKSAPYHKEWRGQRCLARDRDGDKCMTCGSTDRVQVHHIIPYRYSHNHDLNNLVTLCRSCHSYQEIKVNKEMAAGLRARWSQRVASAVADKPQ